MKYLLALLVSFNVGAEPIVWEKITEPMEKTYWSLVDDIELVDRECRSDNTLPRVCLYRHVNRCRIITVTSPSKLPAQTIAQLHRMCTGYFPVPVLLRRRFSDPLYLPNQGAPAADPRWQLQNEGDEP